MTAKAKTITVALKDIDKVCRACGRVRASVRRQTYTTKSYKGPCGDSFCFSSCEMSACRPVTALVCDECVTRKADLP